jgi:hypothetical protein
MKSACRLSCIGLLALGGSAPAQQPAAPPTAVPRCYELRLGAWSPAISLGADTSFVRPPPRVELDTVRGPEALGRNGYAVRPAPGTARSIHRFAYWIPEDSGHIRLVWTTGFSGLQMRLRSDGDTLRGVAATFWDFDRPRQTASVVGNRISCAAGSAARDSPTDRPTPADPVVAPLPAGTPPWKRPSEWTGDARPWWWEHLQRATVVVDQRAGGCRPRGPAFENALSMECGVVLAGLRVGTRRSEVEALVGPLGGRVERFPEDAYAEAVVRVPTGTEATAALRLLDDTTRVRYVSFKWLGTLPQSPVPMLRAAGLVEHVVDGVAVTLSARLLVVARGDSVRFVAAARNSTGRRVKLSQQCGPPMDVVITGPDGYRVWLLSEMLGPHGDFTCEIRRSHYAEPGETERQWLAWRAPNRRGEYTAVAGLRGVTLLTHLSAPVRITVR